MKTITFYSYKGGVGRSLALANVANRLSEFGKKVCIVDFDLEAPGLHTKFKDHIDKAKINKGIVDYIYDFSQFQKVPEHIIDFVTPVSFEERSRSDISLISAGNTRDFDYWKKLSCIDWKKLFYEKDSQGVAFFYNLKEQIRSQLKPDFLLIDSRTGITDISGITMSIFADEVVLLAANNLENLEGVGQVINTLLDPNSSLSGKVPKLNFVLARIPYFPNAKDKPKEAIARKTALRIVNQELTSSVNNKKLIDKVLVIHSDPELEMEEKFKISYQIENNDANVSPIGLDYLELFEELTKDIITEKEKNNFNNFIRLESLIQKAVATSDVPLKIRMLKAAIELNPKSYSAFFHLGIAYLDAMSFEQALENFHKAVKIQPLVKSNINFFIGLCHLRLGDLSKAKSLLEDYNKNYPENIDGLLGLTHTYYLLKEYERSIKVSEYAIQLYPEAESLLNAYGNTLRAMGRYEAAMDYIYKALEVNPHYAMANGSLAELYAAMDNDREFYKNLELSFSFGMDTELFQDILEQEDIYSKYYNDDKFLSILEKYKIDVDWEKVRNSKYLKL